MLLKFAMENWIGDLEYRNLSKEYIKNSILTLKEFQDYCISQEIVKVEQINPPTIKRYLVQCEKERGNNPTTRNIKLRTLRTMFNYLVGTEEIEVNPAKKVEKVKEDIKIEAYNDAHLNKMIHYYKRIKSRSKTFASYRDYVIIVTMLGTGIRLGEMRTLLWDKVDLHGRQITVFGKLRKETSVPLTDKLIQELTEYYLYCKQHFADLSPYVFPSNRKNDKLSVDGAKSIFRRLKEEMNLTGVRLSAHTFRHTFAHMMLMNGCDVFTLQKMLRHSDVAMTQKYVAVWGTALKEQNDKYNPLNKLSI